MGIILFVTRGNSLIWSLPWVVVAGAVYVTLIFKLGTFSTDELDQARDGLGFVKPLLARWSNKLKETVP
jgi:hypothetical protein